MIKLPIDSSTSSSGAARVARRSDTWRILSYKIAQFDGNAARQCVWRHISVTSQQQQQQQHDKSYTLPPILCSCCCSWCCDVTDRPSRSGATWRLVDMQCAFPGPTATRWCSCLNIPCHPLLVRRQSQNLFGVALWIFCLYRSCCMFDFDSLVIFMSGSVSYYCPLPGKCFLEF